jgi:hypothetical protein
MDNLIAEAIRNASSRDLLDVLKGVIDKNQQQPAQSVISGINKLLADEIPVQVQVCFNGIAFVLIFVNRFRERRSHILLLS